MPSIKGTWCSIGVSIWASSRAAPLKIDAHTKRWYFKITIDYHLINPEIQIYSSTRVSLCSRQWRAQEPWLQWTQNVCTQPPTSLHTKHHRNSRNHHTSSSEYQTNQSISIRQSQSLPIKMRIVIQSKTWASLWQKNKRTGTFKTFIQLCKRSM